MLESFNCAIQTDFTLNSRLLSRGLVINIYIYSGYISESIYNLLRRQ